MRLIKKWRIVLIIAVAVIAIPTVARVRPSQTVLVEDPQAKVYQQTAAYNEVAKTSHVNYGKVGRSNRVTVPQSYYDRRRAYWEKRIERRANYLDEEDGNDDDDSADSDDSKDSKDSASDDDEGDSISDEEELIERRREYLRDRLDRDWD